MIPPIACGSFLQRVLLLRTVLLVGGILAVSGVQAATGANTVIASVEASGNLALEVETAPTQAELRVGRTPGRTRMVVDLSEAADYNIFELSSPDRIVIDLDNTVLTSPVPATLFAATPVDQMRTGVSGESKLRLVLDLAHTRLRWESFTLRPDGPKGHRLVLDLYVTAAELPVADVSKQEAQQLEAAAPLDPEPETSHPSPAPVPPPGRPTAQVASASSPLDAFVRDLRVSGYGELAGAYTVADPTHWSKFRARMELGVSGSLDWGARFKLVTRADVDAAYFALDKDFYPSAVQDNQRSDFSIREAYLDMGAGDWEYRLGRQHVVWGEMVGLFVADVVSARDTREFYLVEFETMRIPQWAIRAERFSGDSHFELLWLPYPSYDEPGKPGADFYPFPVPPDTPMREEIPNRGKLSNTSFGARYSYLISGWDLSGFYYQSNDVAPTLYRTDAGLELRHDRIDQVGATFSKDYRDFVLKGEAVYTDGRAFLSTDPLAPFGLQESDILDFVFGVMVPRGDYRFDAQFYGRQTFDHDKAMGFDAQEVGLTFLLNRTFGDRFQAELLYLTGLNRSDWSLQPRLIWNITQTSRLKLGADLFGGSKLGYFGQYDRSDRVTLEFRKWF